MAAHWVVFVAALCVLGGGCAAPCEPCDVVEPVVPVFPAPPAAPCLSQNIEATPGTVVPYVVDTIEEVISPCAPPLIFPKFFTPSETPAPCLPPVDTAPCAPPAVNPAPCNAEGKPVALPTPLSFPIPIPPSLPASSIFSILSQAQNGGDPSAVLSQVSKLMASTLPCPHLQAAAAATPPPQAPGDAPANKAPPIVSTPTIQTPVSYLAPAPSILSPTPKVDPVPVEAAVAGCGQAVNPATFAALQPYANVGPIPIPPSLPASSIFSILSQAQNGGDPSAVLSQVSKFLASTLPCPHLQAAAAATPPLQAPGDSPANKAPPIVSTPTIQTPVSYLAPAPSILSPTSKVDPVPVESAVAGCGQAVNPATYAALQPYANVGLRSPPPEILSQLNLAASLPAAEAPSAVEVAEPAFEFPKFGQATRQLITPWRRVYEPLRRMYTPHRY